MPALLDRLLALDDADVEARWQTVQAWLLRRFGRAPGLEAALFLIGVQEQGAGFQPELPKEAKQDLIMEGTCHAFAALGLYRRVVVDGAAQWVRAVEIPSLPVDAQEKLLRLAVAAYFEPMLDAEPLR